MTWAKLDDTLPDHPKVDGLLEHDEMRGLAALGLFALSLCRSSQQLTDGEMRERAVRRLAPEHGVDLAALLVEHGLFDQVEGGFVVHDFLDWNPSRDEVLERRRSDAQRKAEARAAAAAKRRGGGASGPESDPPSGGPSGRTSGGVRADAPAESGRPSALPDPTRPDPSFPPTPEGGDLEFPMPIEGNRQRDRLRRKQAVTDWMTRHLPGSPVGNERVVDQFATALRRSGVAPTVDAIRAMAAHNDFDLMQPELAQRLARSQRRDAAAREAAA